MDNLKTVEGSVSILDPLYAKQKEDVARMRASLLSCTSDTTTSQQALRNVAILRIYHQISRIIRYLELMDKLEDKLYRSIEHTIDSSDEASSSTWFKLLGIQEKLQKSMIESHKLLQPYLDLESYSIMDLAPQISEDVHDCLIMDSSSRERLRTNAQAVLSQLNLESGYHE